MTQKRHLMHGRDHLEHGADPIPGGLLPSTGAQASVFTDTEAYVTLATINWWQGVLARVQPAGPGVAGGAYSFLVSGGSTGQLYRLIDSAGAAGDSIGTVSGLGLVAGDKVGITCVGNQIRGWVYHSGVWTNVVTATDSTLASGYLGIYQIQQAGRLDNWGGGVSSSSPGDFATPVLDDFNRADEEPLSNGNWTTRTTVPLKVTGNQVTQGGTPGVNTYAGAYWTPTGGAGAGDVLGLDEDGNPAWLPPTTAKTIELKVLDDATVLTTGDGKLILCVPAAFNGLNLTDADAYVTTVSSSGLPTVQIRNVTQAADMLSTRITIDASEFTSYTAATPAVVDTGNDDVATGDLIAIDVDVAGTGAKGLGVILVFS